MTNSSTIAKGTYTSSQFFDYCMVESSLQFFEPHRRYKTPMGTPLAGAINIHKRWKMCNFWPKSPFIN